MTRDEMIEQWRIAMYPHIDAPTFAAHLADTTATGWDEVRSAIDALVKIAALRSRPAPPDDLEDVAMAARRGLAFGHQATPQTPERMIERKEQALGQILDICERHGVSSSVLRAPAPVAAPAPADDRRAEFADNHALYDPPAPETPAPDAMPETPDDVCECGHTRNAHAWTSMYFRCYHGRCQCFMFRRRQEAQS
jgi:hypothetical protein